MELTKEEAKILEQAINPPPKRGKEIMLASSQSCMAMGIVMGVGAAAAAILALWLHHSWDEALHDSVNPLLLGGLMVATGRSTRFEANACSLIRKLADENK